MTAALFSPAYSLANEAVRAQDVLSFGGYLETYYIHDFDHAASDTRPGFAYSHNRLAQPSINLAIIKARLETDGIRANLALGSGTYMRANYALEPKDLQKIFEANIGLKLSDRHNLWLDAGVMPSHIGFESAVGVENWTVTRSLLADNSPYFETGLRLSYTSEDGKWYASGLLLNGWQRIQRPDGNTTPAFGHQFTYKPNAKITLNSSSFFGNDKPDSVSLTRVFHNFYGIFQITDKFGLTLGLDTGSEENAREGEDSNFWYSPVVIARYAFNDRVALAVRGEYYSDENGVIIATGTENGFKTMGFSANLDVQVHRNALWRIEGKLYSSEDDIFLDADGNASNTNAVVTTALCVWF